MSQQDSPVLQPVVAQPSSSTGHTTATLARSSALMASGTLVSRILGLVRVILLAGAVGLLDAGAGNAWQTANTLPNTIYILLAGGVLNVVLVPSLTRAMSMADKGRAFTDRLITLMLLSLAAVTVVVTAGAALLTKFYALSWSGEQLALAVTFAYLCLPQIFFYGLYTMLGQILNAQERFGWYMWAPVANNIVAIAGIVLFSVLFPQAQDLSPGAWTPEMIWLLGGTATLGVLVQALVLLVPVWRSGFRWRPRWGFRGVGLGAASRVALWTLGVIGVSQAGLWLSTNVLNRASELDPQAAGKIIYENAFLFFILPHSLIATSLITAMFTRMSRAAQAGDLDVLGGQYRHGLRLLGAAMVPISVAMVVLAPAITYLLLFRNSFEEAQATAVVTMGLVVGLAPYSVYILSGRIFHAFQDGRTPFKMQLAITAVSVTGTLIAATLPPERTAVGIGLAQTAGQLVAAMLGLMWVRQRLGRLPLGDVRRTWQRAMLATVVAAVPTVGIVLLGRWLLDGRTAAAAVLLVGGPLFFLVYGVVAHRLGVGELAEVAAPILRRLRRRPAGPEVPAPRAEPRLAWAATTTDPSTPQVTPVAGRVDQTTGIARGSAERKERGVEGIEPGTVLGGRYVLSELLAQRGDTLDYWSAQDGTLERLVAVTVLPSTGEHEQAAQSVLDGARRVAGVDDPRLVRVLDVGQEDGRCWIVEEGLLEAESLASLVAERPLPAEEARRIVGEAASGMESARRRGLHHLFLNPHSVLRTREGNVKVSGVAVAAAIEQIEEIPAVQASLIDTNDLVCLLYTGLTGRWPGEELEGLRSARRLADGTLPAPSEIVPGVPGDLDALCRMTLGADYDPRRGPQTPGELAHQIAPWAAEAITDVPAGSAAGAAAAAAGRSGESRSGAASLTGATAAAGTGAAATPAWHRTEDPDATALVPALPREQEPYYRTAPDAGADGRGEPGDPDDPAASSGLLAASGASAADRGLPSQGRGAGPSRATTGIVLVLIAAVLAAGIYLAYGAVRNVFTTAGVEPEPDPPASTPGSSAPAQPTDTAEQPDAQTSTSAAETDDQETEEEEVEETGNDEPLSIAGITSLDPEGDNDEHNDLVDLAIDGDLDTAWNSHTYLTDGWGGLKSGVGLVVDLGDPGIVSTVEVVFPEGDYGAEVFVGDEPTREGATSIGADEEATATWTVEADEPVTGRYVIIWFSRAWDGPRGEIVYVAEISVE